MSMFDERLSADPTVMHDLYPDAEFLWKDSDGTGDRLLWQIRDGILLNESAYKAVGNHQAPLAHGARLLLVITVISAIAQALGLTFGILTAPRIRLMQNILYDTIVQMRIWQWLEETYPSTFQDFAQWYEGAWQLVRMIGGYPSWTTTLFSVGVVTLGTFVSWLLYATTAHIVARWFGGNARYGQFMGTMALSYAPLTLSVLIVVPGASLSLPFVFLLLLVCKYTATRSAHRLGTGHSLAIILAPYALAMLLGTAATLFVGAYWISQIPYFNEAVRILQLIGRF